MDIAIPDSIVEECGAACSMLLARAAACVHEVMSGTKSGQFLLIKPSILTVTAARTLLPTRWIRFFLPFFWLLLGYSSS